MRKKFLAAVVAAVGVAAPAPAQIGIIIGSGPAGGGPTASGAYLVNDPNVVAVALTEIVALNQNPLNAGLVRLLADGAESTVPLGAQSPALPIAPGAALFAGSPPPGALGSLGLGKSGGGGGGGGGGSGGTSALSPNGLPLLALATTLPENGDPGSVAFTVTDPAGDVLASGSVPVPDGGWWVIGLDDPPIQTTAPPGPGPNTPGSADTPEPATALLAGLGAVAVAFGRRRGRTSATSACG